MFTLRVSGLFEVEASYLSKCYLILKGKERKEREREREKGREKER